MWSLFVEITSFLAGQIQKRRLCSSVLATSSQRADQPISCSAALDILTADVQVIIVCDVLVIRPCYLPVAHLKLSLFPGSPH